MAKQNIFDNEVFYEGYKGIRNKKVNANNLFEIPALFSLLPKMEGKKVLDLGCGYGEHCKMFVESGAEWVTGIDISEKMLDVARKENSDTHIEYINMPMEDIDSLVKDEKKYNLVVSSLAFHYVEDYEGVVRNIYSLLEEGGELVFSQEHPLTTSHKGGDRWTRDENGQKLYVNLANYGRESERESTWFVDNVKKYHRTFSTIINTLTETGFVVKKIIEPFPTEDILKEYHQYKDLFHKPDFILIKAVKPGSRCDWFMEECI